MSAAPERVPDLEWLRSRFPLWTFDMKGYDVRARRPGFPVSTSPSDTLLALAILGLEAWDCRDRAEGKELHHFP